MVPTGVPIKVPKEGVGEVVIPFHGRILTQFTRQVYFKNKFNHKFKDHFNFTCHALVFALITRTNPLPVY